MVAKRTYNRFGAPITVRTVDEPCEPCEKYASELLQQEAENRSDRALNSLGRLTQGAITAMARFNIYAQRIQTRDFDIDANPAPPSYSTEYGVT